jgi:predicted enzyme related to lactoylglutathione lyase
VIKGCHTMFYSSKPHELRAFLRDKLKFPFTDVGEGWLIFDMPQADMGVHPTDHPGSPPSGTHAISFYCDDIKQTVAELKSRDVQFTEEISDQGFGFVTHFRMPGEVEVQLYQPKYRKK